ncbi:MAG: hypothetical protein H6730_33195 [Deltaproteobacteria bacterium]|nr:hypothetical protein [Deltaproteobacteria bacterium]
MCLAPITATGRSSPARKAGAAAVAASFSAAASCSVLRVTLRRMSSRAGSIRSTHAATSGLAVSRRPSVR